MMCSINKHLVAHTTPHWNGLYEAAGIHNWAETIESIGSLE